MSKKATPKSASFRSKARSGRRSKMEAEGSRALDLTGGTFLRGRTAFDVIPLARLKPSALKVYAQLRSETLVSIRPELAGELARYCEVSGWLLDNMLGTFDMTTPTANGVAKHPLASIWPQMTGLQLRLATILGLAGRASRAVVDLPLRSNGDAALDVTEQGNAHIVDDDDANLMPWDVPGGMKGSA